MPLTLPDVTLQLLLQVKPTHLLGNYETLTVYNYGQYQFMSYLKHNKVRIRYTPNIHLLRVESEVRLDRGQIRCTQRSPVNLLRALIGTSKTNHRSNLFFETVIILV